MSATGSIRSSPRRPSMRCSKRPRRHIIPSNTGTCRFGSRVPKAVRWRRSSIAMAAPRRPIFMRAIGGGSAAARPRPHRRRAGRGRFMAVYTDVAAEDLSRFLAGYDIGGLLSYKGIAEGVENSNFLVHTESGHFILTLYERR